MEMRTILGTWVWMIKMFSHHRSFLMTTGNVAQDESASQPSSLALICHTFLSAMSNDLHLSKSWEQLPLHLIQEKIQCNTGLSVTSWMVKFHQKTLELWLVWVRAQYHTDGSSSTCTVKNYPSNANGFQNDEINVACHISLYFAYICRNLWKL